MRPPTADRITEWMSVIKPKLAPFCDRELSDKDVLELVKLALSSSMPKNKDLWTQDALGAAVRSISHLIGRSANKRVLSKNVHRLVANLHFIADGMEIPEWDGTREYTDAILIGVGSIEGNTGDTERYIVSIKLKTGICAGIITCAVLSRRSLQFLLLHVLGTSKYECAVEEVAGMEASIAVSLTESGFLMVHSWSCNENQKRHNRDLASKRRDVLKCGVAPTPCNVCDKTVSECPLAVWLPKAETQK